MQHDPALPPEPLPLTEASVQEIQLELIRRTQFNLFDGRKIVASLRRHRKLWRAVVLDQTGIATGDGLTGLELIKLRDLHTNRWNVDTLFILCDSAGDAQQIADLAVEEEWQADTVDVHRDADQLRRSLGTSDPGYVVSMWWD